MTLFLETLATETRVPALVITAVPLVAEVDPAEETEDTPISHTETLTTSTLTTATTTNLTVLPASRSTTKNTETPGSEAQFEAVLLVEA